MWIALGILLLGVWVVAKFVAGVASMAIHVALVVGVIALVVHFVRRGVGRVRGSGTPAAG